MTKRILAGLLTLALAASLLCVGIVPAAAAGADYLFDVGQLTAAADKESLVGGSFAEGYIATFGELTKRTSSKGDVSSVEVGKNGASGFTFTVGGTAEVKVEFSSTGGSNASTVGLWNEAGELVPNNEGVSVVEGTGKTALTWSALPAGTYKVVSPDASEYNRGARVYSISVEDSAGARAPRKAWSEVADPAITDVQIDGGTVTVRYAMDVGYDGADAVSVTMLGDKENASADGLDGAATFTPQFSGQYTFAVTATREGETDKTGHADTPVSFTLPLAAPVVANAASLGDGGINVDWDEVTEATGYNVYMDGGAKAVNTAPVEKTEFAVTGLALNSTHTFTVTALRGGEESAPSEAVEGTATPERQQAWRFATFGVSTKPEKNYAQGDLNKDGQVTVIASGGAGKILANSSDGLAFYYTAIPTDKNFTLRAKVHVNSWENSSSQNGFGVAALDRVGSGSKEFWNNSYLAGGMRYAYYYDEATGNLYAEDDPSYVGVKYNMRLGLASLGRTGVTWEGLDAMGGEVTAPPGFTTQTARLETYALSEGKGPGTYNLIGNGSALEGVTRLDNELTDFVLEVQRNNTGYFTAYYDDQGNLLAQNKSYDPKALDQLDSDYVYAGFFAARVMDATFSDVTLKVNDPAEDPAPEPKPKTQVMPKIIAYSTSIANSADYDLIVIANAAGTVTTTVNGGAPTVTAVTADGRFDIPQKLAPGKNTVRAVFTPTPGQIFDDPDLELGSTDSVETTVEVTYDNRLASRQYLYVSPAGTPQGDGSFIRPLDIQTAVDLAAPGQTVVVKEGRYTLTKTLTIKKGISGTQEKPIYLIADPAAKHKPVLDFAQTGGGLILAGDWWYLYGIGITGAKGEGVSLAGSHNVLDQVDTYYNLATGVQIARDSKADMSLDYWPSYNLVLNCTSYGNADPGYSDADGFAAKLTAGVGNVFDGCVSYHNSDDGWDLYAKAEQGPIGKVVLQNCVAFSNGYLEDGTNAGDGNGFKLGGESITAYHEIHNSVSFQNKSNGITCNSCPDIQVFNCTVYNNESSNVNFYTKLAKNTDFAAQGVLSFKDSAIKSGKANPDSFEPVGTQDVSKYQNDTNYFWDGAKSVNNSAATAEAAAFASLDFKGFTRKADGTVDLGDFLKLTAAAPAGVGAVLGGTPSRAVTPIAVTTQADGVTTTAWPDGEKVTVAAAADGAKTITVTDAAGQTVAQVSLPAVTPTPATAFADVAADHWAAQAVNALAGLKLVEGVENGRYDLTSSVTRASLAQILARLAQGKAGKAANFPDVAADAWYAAAVAWCADVSVITGYGSGDFGPNDPITREQLCLMLQRFAGLLGADASGAETALDKFPDAAKVSPWAADAMAWGVEKGILQGDGAGSLNPQGTASRAETAVMLWRFLNALYK